ncbi:MULTISPECIES: alpha/beta fold hydrolase [unclassified Streptomyces]|uniref:alpha/beta fold hydrolase n=1 Tax=unclassified Streptomyces TaxID=2593676 RepID=UPI00278C1B15|nr:MULTISPECIES: alpha/beta hydrolase [unclassified Streptomyces]
MTAEVPAGRLVDVHGAGVHVTDLGGAGTPTVLLHGGGPGCSAWTDFGAVAHQLGEGRRLLLVDLPQYGGSDSPDITGGQFAFHADHVRGLLDQLGVERADFVCQSLGGSVALLLAARHPERVGRLVITGSTPVPGPARDEPSPAVRAREEYYGDGGPSPAKMRALMTRLEWYDPTGPPQETVELRHRNAVAPRALARGTAATGRGEPEDLGALLGEVAAPVLLLWGAYDPFCSPVHALALADRLPRADMAVLSRTSHHPAEERPGRYAALARAFLDPAPVPSSVSRSL